RSSFGGHGPYSYAPSGAARRTRIEDVLGCPNYGTLHRTCREAGAARGGLPRPQGQTPAARQDLAGAPRRAAARSAWRRPPAPAERLRPAAARGAETEDRLRDPREADAAAGRQGAAQSREDRGRGAAGEPRAAARQRRLPARARRDPAPGAPVRQPRPH